MFLSATWLPHVWGTTTEGGSLTHQMLITTFYCKFYNIASHRQARNEVGSLNQTGNPVITHMTPKHSELL